MNAITANVPAVMKNTLAMELIVYAMKITDSVAPFTMEYNTKSSVAVTADSLFIAPLMPITSPNSAMTRPQNSSLLVTMAYAMPGLLAMPKAVKPVITSASVIHK